MAISPNTVDTAGSHIARVSAPRAPWDRDSRPRARSSEIRTFKVFSAFELLKKRKKHSS